MSPKNFVLSSAQMRGQEAKLIKKSFSALAMMEQVASQMAQALVKQIKGGKNLGIVALVGPGNNGADALAVLRIAKLRFPKVFARSVSSIKVLAWDSPKKSELRLLQEQFFMEVFDREVLLTFADSAEAVISTMPKEGIFLDGLFGAQFERRPLSTESQKYIASLRAVLAEKSYLRIAVDLPSGLLDSGNVAEGFETFRADISFCVGGPKTSQIQGAGVNQSGRLQCFDLGLPISGGTFTWVNPTFFKSSLKQPAKSSHKNTRGRVLVVGGNLSGGGATRLVARAALQMGAGFAAVIDDIKAEEKVEDFGEWLTLGFPVSRPAWEKLFDDYDVLVFGCGLPTGGIPTHAETQWRPFFEALPHFAEGKIIVVDGGGLVSFCRHFPKVRSSLVFTPHPKEAAEILPLLDPQSKVVDRLDLFDGLCRALQRKEFKGALLLKGAYPLCVSSNYPSEKEAWNIASAKLATAGSGDVLAGAIAGLSLRIDESNSGAKAFSALRHALWAQAKADKNLRVGSLASEIATEMSRATQK